MVSQISIVIYNLSQFFKKGKLKLIQLYRILQNQITQKNEARPRFFVLL